MKKHLVVISVLLLLTSMVISCADNKSGGGNPFAIGPNGGTVSSSDKKASVIIPAGALTRDTNITITSMTSPTGGNIGTVYDFAPDGTTFGTPVTISITYDDTALPQGVPEQDLKLGSFANNQWQEVAGSTVDTTLNVVSGNTSHFSLYGILPSPPQVGPQTFTLGSGRTPTGIAAYPGGGVVAVGKPASGIGQIFVTKLFQNGTTDWSNTTHAGSIDGTSLTGSTIPRVAVGPTGNIYVAIGTTLDENGASLGGRTELRITSFNPSGVVRVGWPVRINVDYYNDPANIMIDSSDNLYIYGLSRNSNLLLTDSVRPFLRILNSGGTLNSAPTVDFTGTQPNRMIFPDSIGMDPAGTLYLSALVVVISSPTDTGNGVHLLALNSSGTVTSFPKQLSNDIPPHGAPLTVGPAGNVYVLGSQLYGLNPNGSVMTGFPKDAPMPSARTVGLVPTSFTSSLVASAIGNLYFAGWVEGQSSSLGAFDVFVQSLNSTGAQRAGFPVFTGTSDTDYPTGVVIDSSGSNVWALWYSDTSTASRIANVTRFNAN